MDNSEEYTRYNQIANEKKLAKKESTGKKPTKWKLVFKVGDTIKEEIVSGAYSLCAWAKKKYANDQRYKIIPVN